MNTDKGLVRSVAEIAADLQQHSRRTERRLDLLMERMEDLEKSLREKGGLGAGAGAQNADFAGGAEALEAPVALKEVMGVVRRMTPRQQGTLLLMLEGAQGMDVAKAMGRDISTAKSAMASVTHLLGENRAVDAVVKVREVWGKVSPEDFKRSRGMDIAWGREAVVLLREGREAEIDRSLFVEQIGRAHV